MALGAAAERSASPGAAAEEPSDPRRWRSLRIRAPVQEPNQSDAVRGCEPWRGGRSQAGHAVRGRSPACPYALARGVRRWGRGTWPHRLLVPCLPWLRGSGPGTRGGCSASMCQGPDIVHRPLPTASLRPRQGSQVPGWA